MPIRKISRNKKQKYGPDEIYQNEMKVLNMKRAKPKTYRDEMSF